MPNTLNAYKFPGFPGYLHKAAVELDLMEAERPAYRITTFAAMANLCAQVGSVDSKDAPTILAKAIEFRDQLHVASRAADLMLEEVKNAIQAAESTIEERSTVVIHPRKGRR